MKFYTHRAAFDTERAAHAEPPLRDLMHATIAIEDNAGGAWRAPNGYAFPPFIIMQEATSIGDFYRPMHEPASPRYIGFEVRECACGMAAASRAVATTAGPRRSCVLGCPSAHQKCGSVFSRPWCELDPLTLSVEAPNLCVRRRSPYMYRADA